MKTIAIIGAGFAGISLARQLQHSAKVQVFEKSSGFGGRMATRRAGSYQFDHGAQFFTARSKQFKRLIRECVDENHVQAWQARVLTLDSGKKPYKREWFEPHYIAVPGMASLCKTLAEGLNVSLDTRVVSIEAEGPHWLLSGQDGEQLGQFDWVITTTPAPQAAELLPECFAHRLELDNVDFSPCLSLMLGFESEPMLKFDACVVRNSPLAWIALDSRKHSRPSSFSMVVHSDNEWARTQIESDIDDTRNMMLEELEKHLGDALPRPEHIAIHRWRYARAETSCEENFLLDKSNRLAACGDWCGGARVEDAYRSAIELGKQLTTN
ncbi:MAG: hypothetical protein DHS20C12_06670 [Pseudohongiella sp.]|nr:MAG: hypothetical protein DHS20C12_06670 [Pseudohongiella sp.]